MATNTEVTAKRRIKDCKLKAFIFDDGTYTSSWKKAVTRFNAGEKPYMIVQSKEAGQVKTSKITQMSFHRGHKTVETDKGVYEMKGIESQKKVSEIHFFVPGGTTIFSTKDTMQLVRVLSLIDLGCNIRSKVFFKDGTSHFTSDIIEIYPMKKMVVTEDHSVYRWG